MDQTYNFELRIQVQILNEFSHSDVAPLLDELNKHWVFVDSSRTSFNPPAAGAWETLITITLGPLATKIIWELFFSEIVKEAGHAIQTRILELIHSGTSIPAHETHPPVSIICGKVRLYFTDDLTPQQLNSAMIAAKDLGEGLPPEKFVGDETVRSPDCFFTYFWDDELDIWLPNRPRVRGNS